jgi:hypothetical protein
VLSSPLPVEGSDGVCASCARDEVAAPASGTGAGGGVMGGAGGLMVDVSLPLPSDGCVAGGVG